MTRRAFQAETTTARSVISQRSVPTWHARTCSKRKTSCRTWLLPPRDRTCAGAWRRKTPARCAVCFAGPLG